VGETSALLLSPFNRLDDRTHRLTTGTTPRAHRYAEGVSARM